MFQRLDAVVVDGRTKGVVTEVEAERVRVRTPDGNVDWYEINRVQKGNSRGTDSRHAK